MEENKEKGISREVNSGDNEVSLSVCVSGLMDNYFKDLNGYSPRELYRSVMDEVERPLLVAVLQQCQNNRTEASQMLGINRGTLLKKIKYHNLI